MSECVATVMGSKWRVGGNDGRFHYMFQFIILMICSVFRVRCFVVVVVVVVAAVVIVVCV